MIKEYEKLTFNIAGITFENREKNLIKLLNQYAKEGYFEKYGGYTNKEIKEDCMEVFEYEDFSTNDIQIKKVIVKDKPAYEVYLKDYNGNFIMIGYIPKNMINNYTNLFNKYTLASAVATIVGGKYKEVDEDEYGKEKVVIQDYLNIGVQIELAFKLNEPVYSCNECNKVITKEIHINNNGLCEECSKQKLEKLENDIKERKEKNRLNNIIALKIFKYSMPIIIFLTLLLCIVFPPLLLLVIGLIILEKYIIKKIKELENKK